MNETLRLSDPFPFEDVRFLPKKVNGNEAMAVFYVTARAVMDRLDACGAVWSDDYDVLDPKHVVCRLTVNGITRADVGDASEGGVADPVKGAFSDAFKRAAVKHGIGRYLYELGEHWAPCSGGKFARFTPAGVKQLKDIYERLVAGKHVDDTPPTTVTPPRPASDAAMQQFWIATAKLGFSKDQVHKAAGVETTKGFTRAELESLLSHLKKLNQGERVEHWQRAA